MIRCGSSTKCGAKLSLRRGRAQRFDSWSTLSTTIPPAQNNPPDRRSIVSWKRFAQTPCGIWSRTFARSPTKISATIRSRGSNITADCKTSVTPASTSLAAEPRGRKRLRHTNCGASGRKISRNSPRANYPRDEDSRHPHIGAVLTAAIAARRRAPPAAAKPREMPAPARRSRSAPARSNSSIRPPPENSEPDLPSDRPLP